MWPDKIPVRLFLFLLGFCCFQADVVSSLPVDSPFWFPSPLPTWPPGSKFGTGEIDLGGLQVRLVRSFRQVWRSDEDENGATFYEPDIPAGFSMLGSFGQPNNRPLFGWLLVGKPTGDILKPPMDYAQASVYDKNQGYFWLPIPPVGYKPVGQVVTTTPDKPPVDKIMCVREDFTEDAEIDEMIWSFNGGNVFNVRPKTRDVNSHGVGIGSFIVLVPGNMSSIPISCLKNKDTTLATMPNLPQIEALYRGYSPYIYLNSEEEYFPSSVNWFFSNGALLYQKGQKGNPIPIKPDGANLPQGGPVDGESWIGLPLDEPGQARVKAGDLNNSETYLHVKPILGATFTDIQVWLFYPFNGHATAKLGVIIKKLALGRLGEHVGDWEHITLRVNNFDGVLHRVFFAEHSKGQWIDPWMLQYQNGSTRFMSYSAWHSHAMYNQAGINLRGKGDYGVRDDTDGYGKVWDTAVRFSVVEAAGAAVVAPPPWLGFNKQWGPDVPYKPGEELREVEEKLSGFMRAPFKKLLDKLPPEFFVTQGPVGPKVKGCWVGDEAV